MLKTSYMVSTPDKVHKTWQQLVNLNLHLCTTTLFFNKTLTTIWDNNYHHNNSHINQVALPKQMNTKLIEVWAWHQPLRSVEIIKRLIRRFKTESHSNTVKILTLFKVWCQSWMISTITDNHRDSATTSMSSLVATPRKTDYIHKE